MQQNWNLVLEKELIRKSKRNSKYFERIYNYYYQKIYRFTFYKVADEALTEEIVSDTFYKAIVKLKSYDESRLTFSSWLYKIALNEIRQYFRKAKSEQYLFCLEDLLAGMEIGDPESAHEDQKRKLEPLLLSLSKDELSVLELRYYGELSFRDLGAVLGLTENAAKMKVHRVIKKLREEIIERGEE